MGMSMTQESHMTGKMLALGNRRRAYTFAMVVVIAHAESEDEDLPYQESIDYDGDVDQGDPPGWPS